MPVNEVVHIERFVNDTIHGALSYNPNCPDCLPVGFVINRQGYRSPLDFDSHTVDSVHQQGKKVVLVLGDSYTEGCCAQPLDSSFMDIVFQKESGMVLLNAGVGGTGLLEYERILHRLLDSVAPDLVMVNFYMGNDLAWMENTIVPPGIPHVYPIKDYMWLSSIVPPHFWEEYGSVYFQDHREAYDFYIDRFTLFGNGAGWAGRLVRSSVVLSRTLLLLKNASREKPWRQSNKPLYNDRVRYTRTILARMSSYCTERSIPIFFALIPSAEGPWDESEVKKSFSLIFQGFPFSAPDVGQFSQNDYDGGSSSNHYNNSGHRKHARFLMQTLDSLSNSLP